jgi:hypothetical protein
MLFLTLLLSVCEALKISEIQGNQWLSPYNGRTVHAVQGIVTGIDPKYGFYMQDPNPDNDPATSEAIFVYYPHSKDINAGDHVNIAIAQVKEFKGRPDSNSLTELIPKGAITKIGFHSDVLSVIEPKELGGPRMPNVVLYDRDIFPLVRKEVDVDAMNEKLDLSRGLDYFESFEHMLVKIHNPMIVSKV